MSVTPIKFTDKPHELKETIDSLYSDYENGDLNLSPSYQRGKLWSNVAKVQLIQSILGNIHMPPLIFSKNKKGEIRDVVDGKQRLSTIFDFMDDKIRFYNEDESEKSCLFSELDETLKKKFKKINLSTVEYSNLTEEKQRDIFERINHGVSLSYGEKLKGMNSKWIKDITDIVKIIEAPLNDLGINTKKRCKDYECAVAIFALLRGDSDYISKGKSCLTYIKMNDALFTSDEFKIYGKKIKSILKIIVKIYKECVEYCENRGYKKCKIKWTDLLIYIHMINNDKKSQKMITRTFKYLLHLKNKQNYIEPTSEFENYNDLFSKRSNTNVANFIEDRVESITKLFNSINRNLTGKKNKELRSRVYIKCGTVDKIKCKICDNHEIASTNFQLGHIISRYNGGTYQLSNLVPICAPCNGSKGMGKTDMDIFLKNESKKPISELFKV